MIYRLDTDNRILQCDRVRLEKPYGIGSAFDTNEYDNIFEEISAGDVDIGCRLFKAPLLPEWRVSDYLVVERLETGFDFPDILHFGLCTFASEKAKEVIVRNDAFGHQFWPISLVDEDKNKYREDQYYRVNVRRYVDVYPSDVKVKDLDFFVDSVYGEDRILSAIRGDADLRAYVEGIPLWMKKNRINPRGALYIGPEMMATFREAGLKGLKEYSCLNGKNGEYVGHA